MNQSKCWPLFKIGNTEITMNVWLCLIMLIAIAGSLNDISLLLGAVSFWLIMFIHELGHMFVANKLGLRTERIELYVLHGLCYYEPPKTEFENYLVAWGGVAAQAIVFIPFLAVHMFFGDQLPWYLATPVVFLGLFNMLIAIINLTPVKWFDGGRCWKAIPLYFKYKKPRPKNTKKKSSLKVVK